MALSDLVYAINVELTNWGNLWYEAVPGYWGSQSTVWQMLHRIRAEFGTKRSKH